jgi:hypothetical protein
LDLHRGTTKAWTAVAALIVLALLTFGSASASAAPGHSLLDTFSTGPETNPQAVATDSSGNVYVLLANGGGRIAKYDAGGNPVPFAASGRQIEGNQILGTPGGPLQVDGSGNSGLAVDRTGGPTDGNIYFAGPGGVAVFDSTGAYKGHLASIANACGVAINQATGQVYVADTGLNQTGRYAPPTGSPGAATRTGALFFAVCQIAVDSNGNLYAGYYPPQKWNADQFESSSPEPSQTFDQVGPSAVGIDPVSDAFYIDVSNVLIKWLSDGTKEGSEFGSLSSSRGVAGVGDGKVLTTDSGGGVFTYGGTEVQLPVATTGAATNVTTASADLAGSVDPDGAGGITACEFRYGPDTGYSEGSVPCAPPASPGSPITSPAAVSAGLSGLTSGTVYHYRLFASNANGTNSGGDGTFTTAPAIEGVATAPASAVKNDSAELNGSFVGDGNDTHYYFEWGRTNAYGHTAPASPADAGSSPGQQDVPPIAISGLISDTTYHFRLVADDADGVVRGQDETFTTATAVANLTAEPVTGLTNVSAELRGSFDRDPHETNYYFEWGPTEDYGNTVPAPPGNSVPAGNGRYDIPAETISGLQPGATYHYRLVAENSTGRTFSADATFRTAEAPQVGNLNSRNLQATSAELVGEVNPRLGDTTYTFEWGTTAAYGNKSPVPDASAGNGDSPIFVSTQLTDLTPGVTYHFRLVATSQYGSSATADQTFVFYPPNCPNAQLRQETRSNSLPDCRAYELVTPSFAQGSIIFPLGGPPAPLATKPSKIAYTAAFGTFPDSAGNPQNILGDMFVSTRSDTGWYQKYVGRPANEAFLQGMPPKDNEENWFQSQWGPSRIAMGTQASPDLGRLASYDMGWPDVFEQKGIPSNAPYVWNTSDGSFLERWPSNLGEVENGERFVGIPEASADFNHFVFQSNLVFAPGGNHVDREITCCQTAWYPQVPPASIYDNDLATGEVRLASVKSDNTTGFEGYVYNISDDGSHILMAEERAEGATEYAPPNSHMIKDVNGPFYLRVDGDRTIEIGAGHELAYLGATSNGESIYFRSPDQLAADDTDSSSDIYVWHESDPGTLALVSVGSSGSAGNKDDCNVPWNGGGCNVEAIDFLKYSGVLDKIGGFNGGQGGNASSDSAIASTSGDIYFISPEPLVAGKGELGKANLYLFRKGTLRFVAALKPEKVCTSLAITGACASGPVARMQVTPDGTHMAFIVQSQITGYDNGGKTEMYTYDPEKGTINCASCRPDGQPPQTEVLGSQNGLFQTYDGRVFFSTSDPLVPRDTNEAEDTYEYTEGRPQLISSGIGEQYKGFNGYQGLQNAIGFVSVSANGTNVYFASTDTLVTQDHNGSALKIYDARTGGGFPAERSDPNCTAADECHGPGVVPPPLPADRTGADLGPAPKAKAHKHKKKHKHKKHKKHKAKKHKKAAGKRQQGKGKQNRRSDRG